MLSELESLFFISVLDRAKSIEEIARTWNLDRTLFYKYNVVNSLLNKGLIKVVKIEKKAPFFKIDFSAYLDFLENVVKNKEDLPSRELLLQTLKEKDKLKQLFSTIESLEKLPEKLWDMKKIFILSKDEKVWRDYQNSLFVPILSVTGVLVPFLTITEITQPLTEESFVEARKSFLKSFALVTSGVFRLPFLDMNITKTNLNVAKYTQNVISELVFNEFSVIYEHSISLAFFNEMLKVAKAFRKAYSSVADLIKK